MPKSRVWLLCALSLLTSFARGTTPPAAAPTSDLARATRAVDLNCPSLSHRLLEAFGVAVEGAGVGLVALFEAPSALLDYLVSEPKTTAETRHPYFPATEEYAADVRLRYNALVEGIETPACLRAVCDVERLKSPDGKPLSAACRGGGS